LDDPTGKDDAEFLRVIQSIEAKVLKLAESLRSLQ
jgi:protein-tyrosine-phosphatase